MFKLNVTYLQCTAKQAVGEAATAVNQIKKYAFEECFFMISAF